MTEPLNDEAAIRAIAQRYIDGIENTDGPEMSRIFHPDAIMTKVRGESLFKMEQIGGALDRNLAERTVPMKESCPKFRGDIVRVDYSGDTGVCWLREFGLEGSDYNTFFILHKINGSWLVTTKASYGQPEAA